MPAYGSEDAPGEILYLPGFAYIRLLDWFSRVGAVSLCCGFR